MGSDPGKHRRPPFKKAHGRRPARPAGLPRGSGFTGRHPERSAPAGILHKMINPLNIFVDPASGTVKLSGFGLATRLSRENPNTLSPRLGGETLPYISPEQTGRMNRALDYRSDFYSLGATLYELFSGRAPFGSREAMEIIHAHIARQPVPPDKMAPQVPKTLSHIVMKLMAKPAEARYQSHSGLAADLLACVEHLENQGSLTDFPLGRHDIPKELQIAPGLYGREDEIAALEAALGRVSQGATEMVLVSGSAGVGKTALVGEIHRSVAQKNGFFISGKFDQLRHNIPYSALIQALRGLIREVLVEDKSGMERWKSRIRAALGPSGQLMTRVIPELERMIGPQPPLPEMGPLETRNRFTAVLLDFEVEFFVKTAAYSGHPCTPARYMMRPMNCASSMGLFRRNGAEKPDGSPA